MQTPAFVIHSRPYGETSQLVEVFTQDCGRFTLVAKGSRGPRSSRKGLLQPFTLLNIAWRGKGDLKNLSQVECPDHSLRLEGDLLFYGLYLNELIYYLLEAHTPFPEVFDAYARAVMALSEGVQPELALRRFEFLLLQALGYAVDFEYTADDELPIEADKLYGFERELGFVAQAHASEPHGLFLGAHLLAFAQGELNSAPLLQAAKRFSRLALQPYLGKRQLKSRELFLKRKASQ